MKKVIYACLGLLIVYSVYLCSVSVLHGEINFFNDVARDFLLLQELDQKKLVLIGPRTNTSGLFDGPFWTYLNYPAYLIGHGNPVVVGWFWILLMVVFLLSGFYMVKKMFGIVSAYAFTLLMSIRFVPHINGVFHAEANIFFIPVFLYTIVRYLQTKNILLLAGHLITCGILIQLNVGVGGPFLLLSTPVIIWNIYQHKLWSHLVTFLLIPLSLGNFIVFDLKHHLQMTQAVLRMSQDHRLFSPLFDLIRDRIYHAISLELFEGNVNQIIQLIIFVIVLVASFIQIKQKNKKRAIYLLFAYYYFGFLLFSLYSRTVILYHFIYLLIPLTYMWVTSFLNGKYKIAFALIVILIYALNLKAALSYITYEQTAFMGKNPDSWQGLTKVGQEIISRQKNKPFGYFVFSPDAFAYQPRYALLYTFATARVPATEYVKEATTYIIAQPPPTDDRYMDYKWWVRVPVGITAKPVRTSVFPNGYTVLEYHLSKKEQAIPFDKAIELGIHFR